MQTSHVIIRITIGAVCEIILRRILTGCIETIRRHNNADFLHYILKDRLT